MAGWVVLIPPRRFRKEDMKSFKAPTANEVTEYAKSIGFSLDGEHFVSYYEMSGWVLKNGRPMKDWQAAVRYWKSLRTKKTCQTHNKTNELMDKIDRLRTR